MLSEINWGNAMRVLTFLLLILFFPVNAATVKNIEIKNSFVNNFEKVKLSKDETRWMAQKKSLVIGTWLPEISPVVYNSVDHYYRGINADYLALMQKSLGVKITITQYKNEKEALDGLSKNNVDMLLTPLTRKMNDSANLLHTAALVRTYPTLVTSIKNTMQPLATDKIVTIACSDSCPSVDTIRSDFPNAKINFYDNDYLAMSSVVENENVYFIGNNITTSNYLSKYFPQSLSVMRYFMRSDLKNHFILNAEQVILRNIINNFIDAITNETNMQVTQNWLERGNLSFLNKPLSLSGRERLWLKRHKKLRVLINPYYPPFTITNDEDEIRGIMGDILNLIQIQTGLEFEPVFANSNSEMVMKMMKGEWDLIPAATYSNERGGRIAFSDPFMKLPFVVVTKVKLPVDLTLKTVNQIAIPPHFTLTDQLKEKYPHIKWMVVENTSIAMSMVNKGDVDATVTTELSARYIIDHYYPSDLNYLRLSDMPLAPISFALSKTDPELKSILDKALVSIPPREILQLTEKWSKMPKVQIQTWNLYSKQFYLVIAFAMTLIASSLVWGFYLQSEVRKRKESQRQLEIQLQLKERLSRALEEEKNKAILATEAKSQFLASMSHELRTPVSSIVGFLELMDRQALDTLQHKEAIEQVYTTAQSLLGLIGEILDVDKVASGNYQIHYQRTYVNKLMLEICRSFEGIAQKKNLSLHYKNTMPDDVQMLIDPQALRQIMNNLISNALKFTVQGKIDVCVHQYMFNDYQTGLQIIVSDTGCGISADEKATLFQRYSQAEQGRMQTGSGLGLTICKDLVSLMQGTLTMESQPGYGTTLTLNLPVEICPPQQIDLSTPQRESLSRAPLSVLIADDHPTNRLLLKRQLQNIGYEVDEACNGDEAEQMIGKAHYDLLITDINMPGKDGITLSGDLRKTYPTLQIWGLTANAQEKTREKCLQNGMNLCLFKPVSLRTLTHELNKITGNHAVTLPVSHLNIDVLHRNTGGQKDRLNELIEVFYFEARKDLAEAEQAVVKEDFGRFKQAVHRLHGAGQLLEIKELKDILSPIEMMDKTELTTQFCLTVLTKISRILHKVSEEIAIICPAEPATLPDR